MDLKPIGPYMLVDGRLNGGRLLLRAGYHDKPEPTLVDKGFELTGTPAGLNVGVAFSRDVIRLTAEIDSDHFQDWMSSGFVDAMWRIQCFRRQPRARLLKFCRGQSTVLNGTKRRVGKHRVLGRQSLGPRD